MTLQSRRVSSLQVTASRPQTSRISSLLGILTRTNPKPLGAVSTNWNAPELAEYAIPRMNNTLLLHGHTHAHDPLEFGRHHNEINVGLDAWCFEPVNEAELVDNWLQTALSNV